MKNSKNPVYNSEDINISLRYGFIGLGLGGTSVGSACADTSTNIRNNRYPYTSLLINTNILDHNKVVPKNPNSKKLLIGNGEGAGRDIESGEEIFLKHEEQIEQAIQSQFSNSDFIWIVAGLGGGTGTGSLIETIRLVIENGFSEKFGLILTLPRITEGLNIIQNALDRLFWVKEAMGAVLGPVIIVDNQKLYTHFKKEKENATIQEYLDFSNVYVANALHELNVVTASFKPYGDTVFDTSEFKNLLKVPGFLHFARFSIPANAIDTAQGNSYMGKLKEQLETGVLSEGYDLQHSQRLAVSVLANQIIAKRLYNIKFDGTMIDEINKLAPRAVEKPIAKYIYNDTKLKDKDTTDYYQSEVYFYSAFAGLPFPKAIEELVNIKKELEDQNEIAPAETVDVFANYSNTRKSKAKVEKVPFNDLFKRSSDKVVVEPVKEGKKDFEQLFGKK